MSDNWITLVAQPPNFVPHAHDQQQALAQFKAMAPDADEVQLVEHDGVQLFDCGANLEAITCPHCTALVDMDWWGETMGLDYAAGQQEHDTPETAPAFGLADHAAPCCGKAVSLNRLIYDWPQAFGRFAISAMNPNISRISEPQLEAFQNTLKCDLIVVYQHL